MGYEDFKAIFQPFNFLEIIPLLARANNFLWLMPLFPS